MTLKNGIFSFSENNPHILKTGKLPEDQKRPCIHPSQNGIHRKLLCFEHLTAMFRAHFTRRKKFRLKCLCEICVLWFGLCNFDTYLVTDFVSLIYSF